jgi:hypothetical protein
MSHIVESRTRIVHPHLPLLRETLKLLANEYQGTVEDFYYDYGMQRHPAPTRLALHIPRSTKRSREEALPRGIGLSIQEPSGVLTFTGDPWAVEAFFERIQQQIVQQYTTLAAVAALKKMQCQIAVHQTEQQQTVVKGVEYVAA